MVCLISAYKSGHTNLYLNRFRNWSIDTCTRLVLFFVYCLYDGLHVLQLHLFQGCYFNEVLHEHNTTISQRCSLSCKCNWGRWQCQPKDCYVYYCQAYSYGHYKTFDGSQYTYLGSCEYVLAKPCNSDDFIITVTQRALDSNSVLIDQVTVSVPSHNLAIVLRGGKNQVTINGRNLAAYDGNTMSIGEVKVEWIGSYPHVTFEDRDLDIFWDDAGSVQVSASSNLRQQLCGLCGFYNGDDSDDYRMRNGTTLT